jgi:hypothetical protein
MRLCSQYRNYLNVFGDMIWFSTRRQILPLPSTIAECRDRQASRFVGIGALDHEWCGRSALSQTAYEGDGLPAPSAASITNKTP